MKPELIILVLAALFLLLFSIIILSRPPQEQGVYRLGNLTVCDKYHDKTACRTG